MFFYKFADNRIIMPQSSRDGRVAERITPDFIPPSLWPPRLPVVLLLTPSTRLCDVGNHTGEGLQQREDCKCWKTSPAHRGRWERLDQRIIDGAVKEWWKRLRLRACAAAEGGQFEHELWLVVKQCCCNCAFWLCRVIVWLLIKFALTVFSVLWLFQSHAAVVKSYNAFCIILTANSDTEQNNIIKSTFPVRVIEYFHI